MEARYGFTVKSIVTLVFVLQMIFYNSVVLYLPSMALSAILGISRFYSILIIGLMCVLYSGIGGLKAVVWTDFFQAILMYAAILVVALLGTYDAGGVGQVLELAKENGRLELGDFFNFDLTTRHTLWAIVLGSTLKHIYLVGVNQVQIQRALSLPTLRQGQWSFMFCSLFGALIILLASYVGAVLAAAYRSCDPYLNGEIPRRDAIIVHYVANRLAQVPGLRGVFVAGIFSATLSTLSSFANSMAALTIEDLVKPMWNCFGSGPMSQRSSTWLAKIFATSFGVVCVLMAYVIERANSRLLQATTTMFGAIGVPFLASFALGIFTRFTNTLGILAGFAVTLSLGVYITISQTFYKLPLEPQMPVFYDDQCAAVFNMSKPASSLAYQSGLISQAYQDDNNQLVKPNIPFKLDQISYMTLPVVQFVLMILIASLVSLLTGGLKQEVDDELLMPMVRGNKNHFEPKVGNFYNVSSVASGKLHKLQPGHGGGGDGDGDSDLVSKLASRLNRTNNSAQAQQTYGSHTNKAYSHRNEGEEN